MKPKELIALLEALPEDAEVVVNGYSCDIMGDYRFAPRFQIIEEDAVVDKHLGLHKTCSNYSCLGNKTVKVWVIE